MIDWSLYPNFTKAEFDCKETGENEMRPEALELLQRIRVTRGKPMKVTSGYRSPRHSIEAAKASPGSHAQGLAADIYCPHGADKYTLVKAALECGAPGVGIAASFIHIDAGHETQSRPALWVY